MKQRAKWEEACDRFWQLYDAGREEHAKALLREALKRTRSRPGKVTILQMLGVTLLVEGRRQEGLEAMRQAESVDPTDPEAAMQTAHALLHGLCDVSAAEKKLTDALKKERITRRRRGPVFHEACLLRGHIALSRNRKREAGEELVRSLDVEDWSYLEALGPNSGLVIRLVDLRIQRRACRTYLRRAIELAREWEIPDVVTLFEDLVKRLEDPLEDPLPG